MRRTVLFSSIAAVVVFCAVQDRVTAAGARRYVEEQRRTIASGLPPVPVASVMEPAIRDSVEQGARWAAVVLAAGLAGGAMARRRGRA